MDHILLQVYEVISIIFSKDRFESAESGGFSTSRPLMMVSETSEGKENRKGCCCSPFMLICKGIWSAGLALFWISIKQTFNSHDSAHKSKKERWQGRRGCKSIIWLEQGRKSTTRERLKLRNLPLNKDESYSSLSCSPTLKAKKLWHAYESWQTFIQNVRGRAKFCVGSMI